MYSGDFKNDQPDGYGKKTWHCGTTYEGSWKDGKYHGEGRKLNADGSTYEGQWENSQKSGHGIHTYLPAEGSPDKKKVYAGQFKESIQHGHGKLTIGDNIFKGEFVQGALVDGTLEKYDGLYEGQFVTLDRFAPVPDRLDWCVHLDPISGLLYPPWEHGHGKMQYGNGDVYEGQFENGVVSGQGKATYREEGLICEGHFEDGIYMEYELNGKGIPVLLSYSHIVN